MAVTRLQRKARRNKTKAAQRQIRIKQLLSKPVIKNIDIDKAKITFSHKDKEKTASSAES